MRPPLLLLAYLSITQRRRLCNAGDCAERLSLSLSPRRCHAGYGASKLEGAYAKVRALPRRRSATTAAAVRAR